MFRDSLPEDQGMLFDFKEPGHYRFWMKNTLIPLSIAFMDKEGRVLKITDMEAQDTVHFHASPPETYYALEANRGWFQRHNVKEGNLGKISL
jgi:uncharacterized membrane protein (UPF0127 family)